MEEIIILRATYRNDKTIQGPSIYPASPTYHRHSAIYLPLVREGMDFCGMEDIYPPLGYFFKPINCAKTSNTNFGHFR